MGQDHGSQVIARVKVHVTVGSCATAAGLWQRRLNKKGRCDLKRGLSSWSKFLSPNQWYESTKKKSNSNRL